jgi:DNA-binding transcriptional MerR regulator
MATATREVERGGDERPSRPLTIGAVCRHLQSEFSDISISKIRYLEDQGLVTPRRTQGGYRLFNEDDVDRLETILRLQRDEFLPLRVIRQELASPLRAYERKRPPRGGLRAEEDEVDFDTICTRSGASREFVRDLEDFGLLQPRNEAGELLYPERDVDVVAACLRLARYGFEPRNLRSFRAGADREAGLLEQIVAPALRSRNPERRQGGLEDLEALAALSQELSQLLFWRALRALIER